jgi:cytochrome c peroxidase
MALINNHNPAYYDLGICGPTRNDLAAQTQYCGMFGTPTLRNVATRHVFFHNGVFKTLQEVLDFYNFRDTDPQKVYPRAADGTVQKYNDIPKRYWVNVDVADPPFDRHLGETPAMTDQDEADIIAFLKTLTDGYRPER